MIKHQRYFTPYQYGGFGLPAFSGATFQRGDGLGGLFKGLARSFVPVVKKGFATVGKQAVKRGLKRVGKQALKTGIETLSDVLMSGENVQSSLTNRAKQNATELINSTALPTSINNNNNNNHIKRKRPRQTAIANQSSRGIGRQRQNGAKRRRLNNNNAKRSNKRRNRRKHADIFS